MDNQKSIYPDYYELSGGRNLFNSLEEVLGDGYYSFCYGNIIKYLHRARLKNGLEDLIKARTYLDELIQMNADRGENPK